jgi:hypothetical protein
MELPLLSLDTPKAKAAGTGDISAFDVAIVEFPHGAVAFGLALVLPSATSAVLGFGKLQPGVRRRGTCDAPPDLAGVDREQLLRRRSGGAAADRW